MSQLSYLMEEICSGLEVHFSGRTGGQYLKTSFILCDDYTELVSKLYLITIDNDWSDKKSNGAYKKYHKVMAEVESKISTRDSQNLDRIKEIKERMKTRRKRRNEFFHGTSLLDLSVQPRNCVEAFCDLLDYAEILFKNDWRQTMSACRQLETLEALLLLEKKSFSDQTVWAQVDDLLREWPRREKNKQVKKRGTQYAQYPEDFHLRLCVIWGGRILCEKLKALL